MPADYLTLLASRPDGATHVFVGDPAAASSMPLHFECMTPAFVVRMADIGHIEWREHSDVGTLCYLCRKPLG